MRGLLMASLLGVNLAANASGVGFESTHGQTQMIGIARYIIIGAFVIGIGVTAWAIMQIMKVNSPQASGAEKMNSLIGFAVGVFLIGLGVVIEFNSGAFLGESGVSAPEGIPDNLW